MNKKRCASNETSPCAKKRCLGSETFDSVRNNGALLTMICSFLPVKDRVRLGQVDQQFLADEGHVQVVGVYGNDCLNIEAALEEVREHVEYSCECSLDNLRAYGNTPDSSSEYDEEQCRMASLTVNNLQPSWFNDKSGYDLKAIQEHANFGEDQECVLKALASMNRHIQDNQNKLDNLTADIKKLGYLAPYNCLFVLMEKHDMKYSHFIQAKECADNLKHLRPGRLISFRDADGKIVKTALKACSTCSKVKEDVRDEHCERGYCRISHDVCRDCTTKRTCSTCSAKGCECHFEKCCVPFCRNYMCFDNFYNEGHPECSFVIQPEEFDVDDENFTWEAHDANVKYCKLHKPAGAIRSN
jgi:hypothetical protein